MTQTLKAALIIIGNEILSGRTQDINVQWIAQKLAGKGIALVEIRVVPDIEDRIIEAVQAMKDGVDYLFTTGGIGPTHDDITSESIAKAFGVKLELNAQAQEILVRNYGAENLNPARLKMAHVPHGAALIPNPVSGAPGFIIGNVYVMAGVPKIMQGMMESLLPGLASGAVVYSNAVDCSIAESIVAGPLETLQKKYPDVDIGSYPHFRPETPFSLSLVLRATDKGRLAAATRELEIIVAGFDKNFSSRLHDAA